MAVRLRRRRRRRAQPAAARGCGSHEGRPSLQGPSGLHPDAQRYLRDKRFDCVETAFDSQTFLVGREKVNVEGRKLTLQYEFDKSSGATPSPLQVQRNYANAVRAAGGKVLFEETSGHRDLYVKLEKDQKEIWTWIRSLNDGAKVHLVIIEKEQMKQDVIATAEALTAGIKEAGKVAVYGIYFDTGKAELKRESDAALEEMAKLLKSDSALKVHIVGHTDSTGSFDSNLKLSQARAEAVVKALVSRHGIEAKRLRAHGLSSLAPMASNCSEPGRAKNRRVELVEQ